MATNTIGRWGGVDTAGGHWGEIMLEHFTVDQIATGLLGIGIVVKSFVDYKMKQEKEARASEAPPICKVKLDGHRQYLDNQFEKINIKLNALLSRKE